jgi:hypothetical protein
MYKLILKFVLNFKNIISKIQKKKKKTVGLIFLYLKKDKQNHRKIKA